MSIQREKYVFVLFKILNCVYNRCFALYNLSYIIYGRFN